jgi:hypothetical protein
MAYFSGFPVTQYRFGNEVNVNAFQNLSAYVDVIDDVKNSAGYYTKYTIREGDRADGLSQKLYGTPEYYWTFWLMNDSIRRNGWPLSYNKVVEKAKEDYPNQVVTTRDLFFDKLLPGTNVTGQTSAAQGKVLKHIPDLGQLVIQVTNNKSFSQGGENITDGTDVVVGVSSSLEYLAAHHYETADKEYVDIDPTVGPGGVLTEITYLDRYDQANNELKEINIIRPESIVDVITAFEEAMAAT